MKPQKEIEEEIDDFLEDRHYLKAPVELENVSAIMPTMEIEFSNPKQKEIIIVKDFSFKKKKTKKLF